MKLLRGNYGQAYLQHGKKTIKIHLGNGKGTYNVHYYHKHEAEAILHRVKHPPFEFHPEITNKCKAHWAPKECSSQQYKDQFNASF